MAGSFQFPHDLRLNTSCCLQGLKPVLAAGGNSTDSDDDVFDPDAFVDDDARHRQLRGSVPKKRDFATAPF